MYASEEVRKEMLSRCNNNHKLFLSQKMNFFAVCLIKKPQRKFDFYRLSTTKSMMEKRKLVPTVVGRLVLYAQQNRNALGEIFAKFSLIDQLSAREKKMPGTVRVSTPLN